MTSRMTPALNALKALGMALFPPTCAACGVDVDDEQVVCGACDASVVWAEPPWFVPHDVDDANPPPRLLAPLLYGGSVKDLLHTAKFSDDETAARALVRLLVGSSDVVPDDTQAQWRRHLQDAGVEAVTFVPTPTRRRVRRGFCLPALLADAVGGALGLPVVDLLLSTRTDAPLSKASSAEQRREQVQGRYRLRPAQMPQHVLLVDDIVTTGATWTAAAAALLDHGFDVTGFALAQTERELPMKASASTSTTTAGAS